MTATATSFIDDAAVTALGVRVPAASTDTGMSFGASNAPGIGISDDNPGLDESLPEWTLLDQGELANDFVPRARNAQRSQCIGGPGISAAGTSAGQEGSLPAAVARFATNPANVDGQPDNDAPITIGNGCDLISLATGWEDAL